MNGREILGSADVSDDTLLSYAASTLGLHPSVTTLRRSTAEVVAYDLDAITTGGRWWVTVDVDAPDGAHAVRFFVKLVQSWTRSPLFDLVPPELRELAAHGVPWRTEPLIYRSDLADRLPPGLSLAGVVDVRFVDDLSAVVWLEAVETVSREWDAAALAHAARLLGRLAASPRVRPLAAIGEADGRRGVRSYAEGRLAGQVAPLLRSDDLWHHPLLVRAFGPDLRARLLGHLDRVDQYVEWLERVPEGTAHGDACTNNLLTRAGHPDLVLIDFGFWSTQPLGFDLSQLLLGDVQLGRRPGAELADLEEACVPAYVSGLAEEGCDVPAQVVQRAHALQMLIFSGLSAFVLDELSGPGAEDPPTEVALTRAAERAELTRFVLDLVDRTEGVPAPG